MNRSRVIAIAAVALSLHACGGAPAPRPRPRVTLRAPAPPAQVVLLGTGGADDRTTLTLPTGPRAVEVSVLYVRGAGRAAVGGTSEVELTVRPATDGQVKVGVFEDVAGGAGPAWRAGVWIAAHVAVSVLDKDLTDFTFEASAPGHIDGASASALMAAALVAAILGWEVDADATMSGTIHPDGTVGPVVGLPQKFTAAIAAGKRKLGYPVGQRLAIDEATGEEVDLVELARAGGAEAVEVTDVYRAVELLTGRTLPRTRAVESGAMELPPAVAERLAARVDAWSREVAELLAAPPVTDDRHVAAIVAASLWRAEVDYQRGAALRKQGLVAAGHHAIVEAWIAATAAHDAAAVLKPALAGDADDALAELAALGADETQAIATLRELGAHAPATMGDHLLMLAAFDAGSAAWSARAPTSVLIDGLRDAMETLADDPQDPVAAIEIERGVVAVTATLARARASLRAAKEAAQIAAAPSARYQCSLANVRRLATAFTAAAGSNLLYVEALGGVTTDRIREYTAMAEPDYLVAAVGSRVDVAGGVPAKLKETWGEGSVGWRLFTLAASRQSYSRSTRLASRWHSLRVRVDRAGRPLSVANQRALLNMLEFAEQRARERARAAQLATGEVPVQAQLHYQKARGLRDGDVAAKLDALAAYWAASDYAEAALMLARN